MRHPWLLSIGIVCLFGCSGMQKPKDQDLRSVLDTFCHNLRWQFNDQVAARVDARYAAGLMDQLDDAKEDLHITAWEIRRIEPLPQAHQARARVWFSYYRLPSTVVQSAIVDQLWQEENGFWRLMSQSEGPFVFPPADASKNESSSNQAKEPLDAGVSPTRQP